MSAAPSEHQPQLSVLPTPKSLAHAAQIIEEDAFGADPFAGSHAPEALFISALLESGVYDPAGWDITEAHFTGYSAVNAFAMRYQGDAGRAPGVDHLTAKFPSFPFMSGVSVAYAANELLKDHSSRVLRRAMSKAAGALTEDAVADATAFLKEALETTKLERLTYVTMTDWSAIEMNAEGCNLPEGTQTQILGNHGIGRVHTIAARINVGKSWELIRRAIYAAEGGTQVSFFSLEMTCGEVLDRLHRVALRHLHQPWDFVDEDEKRELVGRWEEQHGTIRVYDRTVSPSMIASVMDEGGLAVVDYIQLMRDSSGRKATEDWRILAGISQEIKEYTRERRYMTTQASQLNRPGAGAGADLSHLSGSDSVGADADVVIFLRDHSLHTRSWSLPKNRHGVKGVRWFTEFNPSTGAFSDVDVERALELQGEEDDGFIHA